MVRPLHRYACLLFVLPLLVAGCMDTLGTAGSDNIEFQKGETEKLTTESNDPGLDARIPDRSPIHVIWTLPLDLKVKKLLLTPPESRMNALLILSEENDLIAVNRTNGRALWWVRLGSEPLGKPAFTRHSIFLIVKGNLLCMSRESGDVLWRDRIDFPPAPHMTAVESQAGDPLIFMAAVNKVIYAMTVRQVVWPPKTGYRTIQREDLMIERRELGINWRFPTIGNIEGPIAIDSGIVFAADSERQVYALDSASIRVGRPRRIWNNITRGSNMSGVCVAGNYVFVTSRDRTVYCYSRNNGGQIWRYETGSILNTTPLYTKDPASKAESLYVTTYEGALLCLNVATGKLRWEMKKGGLVAALDLDKDKSVEDRASVAIVHPDGSATGVQYHSGKVLWTLESGMLSGVPENTRTPIFYTISRGGKAISALQRR